MAKLFKWRLSDRLPLSYPAAIPIFVLVIILSTVSFQMLPESRTWSDNFNTLLMHVAGTSVKSPTATSLPTETLSSPPSLQTFLSPAVTPSPQDVPRNESLTHFEVSEGSSWPPTSSSDGGNDPVLEGENFTTKSHSSAVPSEAPVASPAVLVNDPVLEGENFTTKSHSSAVPSEAPVASPAVLVSVASSSVEEKFLVPLLSWQVGAGNQFMEYLSAAVMARSLNRTLCLSSFFPGPSRHTGRVTSGLAWEDRYEVASLSKFTRVASLQRCLRECHRTLDDKWMLKTSREPRMDSKWKKYPGNYEALNLNWDYVKWTAPEDIVTSLGSRSARCVGMLGLFPGLRWRGAFLAISAFIRPAAHINKLADALQEYALGDGTRYLAVHWRFEESECRGHHLGLCFVRCDDGSVIDSGLHPDAQEWHKVSKTRCENKSRFRGVTLDKNDILATIHERALNHNVTAIYLATDGWLRGAASVALIKEIVESLRKHGLIVVGLWKVPGLPNFANGQYFDPTKTLGKDINIRNLNGAQVALVEQELCSRSVSFMGSGPSTFSLSVFRVRLARRRVKQIEATVNVNTDVAMDDLVAETLLRDAHPAGLHCRYLRHMKRARVNETVETYADEYPDGWLDLEACEGRIGRGGRCRVAECF